MEVLVGHDDDLAGQATAVSNRIRGLLSQVHPALERAIGEDASRPGVLDLLARFGGPTGLRAAGQAKTRSTPKKSAPRMGDRLAADTWAALGEQAVVIPRTAARILITVGDASSFPTAGHLAADAGIAPVTRRSGTSIRGESPSRSGNKNLKNAFFMSAFASLRDPASRAYHDRKRAEGRKHNAAIICLARRRSDVLYAMLRDNQPYIRQMPSAA